MISPLQPTTSLPRMAGCGVSSRGRTRFGRFLLPLLLVLAMLALAGCESSDRKAERYYQSALTLMQEGDVDRALVELRNVFKYNGFHKDARKLYADTQLSRGNVNEAYSQYLRLIEQYPDTLDVRLTLAALALDRGNWDEVERHGNAAIALAPDDPGSRAVAVALSYRKALQAQDNAARDAATDQAETLLAADPDNRIARRVAIDGRLQQNDLPAALTLVEGALEQQSNNLELHMLRFRILANLGDAKAASAALEATYQQFPDRAEVGDELIRWYLMQRDLDGAESLLRRLAGDDPHLLEEQATLVRFLVRARGPEVAMAELDGLIAKATDPAARDFYHSLRAALDFEAGDHEGAIIATQKLLEGAEATDQTRRIRVMLARMLLDTGNPVGAREQVETVLSEDPGQVSALKMRAHFLLDEDKPDAAILDLRAALNGAPRDPAIMEAMAEAHLRAGARDLAGERMAMAVEVSDSAPEYALPYARFLLQDGRLQTAESVLVAARRNSPGNPDILNELGRIWIEQDNTTALQELLQQLRATDSPQARTMAANLEAAMLMRQGRSDEGMAILEKEAGGDADGEAADRSLAALVISRLGNGEIEAAREAVDAARAARPDAATPRLLSAMVAAMSGDPATAEADLRALIADDPGAEAPVSRLVSLLAAQGRTSEAIGVLEAGMAAQPESTALPLMRAGFYRADGDFDQAIALLEKVYAANSDDVTVANDLASMLADYRDDAPSLDRAYTIGRRLSGLKVPSFQDTLGWIEYRRGNHAQALASLKAAAEAIPDDPLIQLHLGIAYAAMGRGDEARPHLEQGLQAAKSRPLPHVDEAQKILDGLDGSRDEAPAQP